MSPLEKAFELTRRAGKVKEFIRHMESFKIDVNSRMNGNDGPTLLHYAVQEGCYFHALYLLLKNADKSQLYQNQTALDIAKDFHLFGLVAILQDISSAISSEVAEIHEIIKESNASKDEENEESKIQPKTQKKKTIHDRIQENVDDEDIELMFNSIMKKEK